ncbi:hypothetical protein J3R82DRAFT_10952 [Butyriboletus roseoflavus]|nr:hypothetical protein J3R82DRAFT_10952 [Butyriboletus roseoflavus]
MDGWHKSRGRVINGLPIETLITPMLHSQLYTQFKDDNPEGWQEILEIHNMIELADSGQLTVAQHSQTFNKLWRRLMSLLEAAAAKHRFEAAIVMCGKTVNKDASLRFTHTTVGAKQFFKDCCHADDNTMIGHLKAHIYNTTSLEIVSTAFDEEGEKENKGKLPMKYEAPKDSKEMMGVALNLEAPKYMWAMTTAPEITENAPESLAPGDNVLNYIKVTIIDLIRSADGDVLKVRCNNFPWATLVNVLASQNLMMQGWPCSVLMSGELRSNSARAKGITILKVQEGHELCDCLHNNEIMIVQVDNQAV